MSSSDDFKPYPNQGPFLEHIGPILVDEDADELTLALQAEERHANHRGTVQGGVLATFADFALGRAIEQDAQDDKPRATVSLTVDYLAPAKPGTMLEARTEVEKLGGRLAFADCSVSSDGREVVRARAVFSVLD
jgi:uncharacterized protein (TIGR00369 family)